MTHPHVGKGNLRQLVAVLVLCSPAIAQSSFSDNFEAASVNPFWTVTQTGGSFSLCGGQNHTQSGTQSACFTTDTTTTAKFIALQHHFSLPTQGNFSVSFYDSGEQYSDQTYYNYLSLTNTTTGTTALVGNADYDPVCYTAYLNTSSGTSGPSAECGPYPQVSTTNVHRTVGWHQLAINVSPSSLAILIDGIQVFSGVGVHSFNEITLATQGPESTSSTTYFDDFTYLNATDALATSTWVQSIPSGTAPPRYSSGVVYNPATNRMVTFGGVGPTPTGVVDNSVWILTNANGLGASSWIEATPSGVAGSPAPRVNPSLAYDQTSNRMILFGGGNCGNFQDYWILLNADGTSGTPQWQQVVTAGTPPPGYLEGTAYDPNSNRFIVYLGPSDRGGCPSTRSYTDTQVWVLTNANGLDSGTPTWLQYSPSGSLPVSRELSFSASNTYDPATNTAVFTGGDNSGGFLNDTWILENANGVTGNPTWVPVNTSGPVYSGREWAVEAYNPSTHRLILYGGQSSAGVLLGDVWVLDGVGVTSTATWHRIAPADGDLPARQLSQVAYDVANDRLIVYGGSLTISPAVPIGETWVLTHADDVGSPTGCTYSVAPSGQAFGASGGLGTFTVNTAASCNWQPVPSASWISLLPSASRGPGDVNYVVSATSGASRSGSISVGGQQYAIDQAGYVCSYSIGPTFASPGNAGGTLSASVNTPSGCPWTAVSNVPWLTIASRATGSGGGVVVLSVAPNTGGPRSGTATIAGQTFSVTQSAGACGALDVSSQVVVSSSQLLPLFLSFNYFSQTITVTNTSGAVIHGPVYVVTLGEPTHYPPIPSAHNSFLKGGGTLTTCYSSGGDYLLLVSGDLSPRQPVSYGLLWYKETFGAISYSTKVLSGTPSH